jgi:hypothetical protein
MKQIILILPLLTTISCLITLIVYFLLRCKCFGRFLRLIIDLKSRHPGQLIDTSIELCSTSVLHINPSRNRIYSYPSRFHNLKENSQLLGPEAHPFDIRSIRSLYPYERYPLVVLRDTSSNYQTADVSLDDLA